MRLKRKLVYFHLVPLTPRGFEVTKVALMCDPPINPQLFFLLKRDGRDGTGREGTLVSGRENAEMDRAHESDVDGHAGLWLLGRPSSEACVLALARRAATYTSFFWLAVSLHVSWNRQVFHMPCQAQRIILCVYIYKY